jgi:hypothetical protein
MKKTFSIILIVLVFFSLSSCRKETALRWYKGNLHTHTTNSDGDTIPEAVIWWYKEHGYNFLAFTDHNFLTETAPYKNLSDENFILIPGMEVSDKLEKIPLHLLALGLHDQTLKPAGGGDIIGVLQNNVAAIRAAGAVPVLCHPNFGWAYGADELSRVQDAVLFEVLNAHPAVNNAGKNGLPSTEEMWDIVLTRGRRMFGLGTDDMHALATYPGKSWIMLRAPELEEKAVLTALEKGDFYVSTGVLLDEVRARRPSLKLRIRAEEGLGTVTFFIGSGGRVLKSDTSLSPSFKFPAAEKYIRAKVVDSKGRVALTQPVF